ncbi:MAG TPA: xanthine dehydrogenase accessory protein XdhC [Candidatus Eisenbacteria bacterium]|nr:xanthine dehydrogenase accessory protein XdhC [Candidatus Eisenbacteria bacterium]
MAEPRFDVWEVLGEWRRAGRRFVMATVIETRGFTPRKGGARMLIASDGETWGTIGGGAIEREVLERSRALLAGETATLVKRHLTQELGMCCGGEMSVFLELIAPAPELKVFGAGYIAKPLAAIAAGCGFDVTVVDDRPEWANEERFPSARVHRGAAEDYARAWSTRGDEFAVVVTHDHALDQRLVQVLLERPLRFLGMVGSIPKQRKFALRLKARGYTAEQIGRLHTPLGIDIGAQTPEEIAVSIAAQLVAVRHGRPIPSLSSMPVPLAAKGAAAEPTEPAEP